jgi:peptidyl-dipeptidase A
MRALLQFSLAALFAAQVLLAQPTVAEAKKFLDDAEAKLYTLAHEAGQATWVQQNFITQDSEALAALANERQIAEGVRLAKAAVRFDAVKLPAEMERKMRLLKLGLTLAAPADPKESAEVTRLAASLDAAYGKGKYCPPGGKPCLDINQITKIMATSNDPKELLDVWRGWHAISPPMRADFHALRAAFEQRARASWDSRIQAQCGVRSTTCPPTISRKSWTGLWEQVRPLYTSLHTYCALEAARKVRRAGGARRGRDSGASAGNIWAQDWSNIYKMVAPADADPGYDLTAILKKRNLDAKQMVRYGEVFSNPGIRATA